MDYVGSMDGSLRVGDKAPAFELPDSSFKTIHPVDSDKKVTVTGSPDWTGTGTGESGRQQ